MVAPGQSLPNWHVGFPAAGEVSFLLSLSFTFGFFFFFFLVMVVKYTSRKIYSDFDLQNEALGSKWEGRG